MHPSWRLLIVLREGDDPSAESWSFLNTSKMIQLQKQGCPKYDLRCHLLWRPTFCAAVNSLRDVLTSEKKLIGISLYLAEKTDLSPCFQTVNGYGNSFLVDLSEQMKGFNLITP